MSQRSHDSADYADSKYASGGICAFASVAGGDMFNLMMQVLAVLVASFVVALAISAVRSRRSIRSCCGTTAANDLRMRDDT